MPNVQHLIQNYILGVATPRPHEDFRPHVHFQYSIFELNFYFVSFQWKMNSVQHVSLVEVWADVLEGWQSPNVILNSTKLLNIFNFEVLPSMNIEAMLILQSQQSDIANRRNSANYLNRTSLRFSVDSIW